MLILLKQSIKTIILLLMFTPGGTYLLASNPYFANSPRLFRSNHLVISGLSDKNELYFGHYFSKDTVTTEINGVEKKQVTQEVKFSIPDQLAKTPINFRINSYINYLNFNDFVMNESKQLFLQAWLKEIELKRLSNQTDSLRSVYANASSWQKEEISLLILEAEKRSIALNEEIPAMYQKAREEEDQYWQSASLTEMTKFQEKMNTYKDSIRQLNGTQSEPTVAIQPAISDTLILYKTAPKADEKKAAAEGIIYKIQIGAYKGKIPDSKNKLIKKLSVIRKVENYVDDKGVNIYTTGKLRLYQEAITMQEQIKQEGIKDAVITAYQNGKRITVDEARKLNNEL